MKTIYKYNLTHAISIHTHKDAKILHLAYQKDELCVWMEVDTEQPIVNRILEFAGTGWEITSRFEEAHYIGTVTDSAGFVWHWYDLGEK